MSCRRSCRRSDRVNPCHCQTSAHFNHHTLKQCVTQPNTCRSSLKHGLNEAGRALCCGCPGCCLVQARAKAFWSLWAGMFTEVGCFFVLLPLVVRMASNCHSRGLFFQDASTCAQRKAQLLPEQLAQPVLPASVYSTTIQTRVCARK